MTIAGVAVVVSGTEVLCLIAAATYLVRSGRVRLSSPTAAQLQAEGQAPAGAAVQAAELKEAA